MITIADIRKNIMLAKKEGNKEKALVLTTFLENAQKIAKADKNREIVDKDLIWIDFQWLNGIGFDIEIDFGYEKNLLVRYGQIITSPINRLIKKFPIEMKRIGKQRLQVGYK